MAMKKKMLSDGIRRYIRRQKAAIKRTAKDRGEEGRLVAELLNKFYKDKP